MTKRTLNGIELITPTQWDENYEWLENVNTSEAGTDLVDIVRSNKLSVSASFQCSSRWYHILYEMSQEAVLALRSYDPLTNAPKLRDVRMRDFSASFQQFSDKLEGEGLWVVNFSLKEF